MLQLSLYLYFFLIISLYLLFLYYDPVELSLTRWDSAEFHSNEWEKLLSLRQTKITVLYMIMLMWVWRMYIYQKKTIIIVIKKDKNHIWSIETREVYQFVSLKLSHSRVLICVCVFIYNMSSSYNSIKND